MFSVVIPLFNKASFVGRAIDSVLGQTVTEFELLVVDDGSTDGGSRVVERFHDPRLRLLRQENAGVSAARNRGIEAALGRWITFLDADDEWNIDFLETILRLTNRFSEAGLCATAYSIVTPDGRSRSPKFRGIPKSGWEGIIDDYFRCAAFSEPPVCSSAVAIRREVFADVGGFAPGKRMGEDLDMWGRIALKYPVAFSSRIGSIYHKDIEDSACLTFHDGDEHPFVASVEKLRMEGAPVLVSEDDVDCYLARLRLENARQYVLNGNYQRATEMVAQIARPEFRLRRLMWGSRFNSITHRIWKVWRRHERSSA